mmetsp:Transcript_32624/g.78412  ORF Transcript_32624/g.78412 Transcript_32624/m.78412 type:complete len:272 (+) Transcript_32624:781-1596(+)
MLDIGIKSLDTGIRHFNDLVGFECAQLLSVEYHPKSCGVMRLREIKKRISDVTPISEVDRKISEIECPLEPSVIECLQKHPAIVLVGYISYHDCRSSILADLPAGWRGEILIATWCSLGCSGSLTLALLCLTICRVSEPPRRRLRIRRLRIRASTVLPCMRCNGSHRSWHRLCSGRWHIHCTVIRQELMLHWHCLPHGGGHEEPFLRLQLHHWGMDQTPNITFRVIEEDRLQLRMHGRHQSLLRLLEDFQIVADCGWLRLTDYSHRSLIRK